MSPPPGIVRGVQGIQILKKVRCGGVPLGESSTFRVVEIILVASSVSGFGCFEVKETDIYDWDTFSGILPNLTTSNYQRLKCVAAGGPS